MVTAPAPQQPKKRSKGRGEVTVSVRGEVGVSPCGQCCRSSPEDCIRARGGGLKKGVHSQSPDLGDPGGGYCSAWEWGLEQKSGRGIAEPQVLTVGVGGRGRCPIPS